MEQQRADRIMVVDDEPDIREILTFNLEAEGYEVITAANAEEADGKLTDEVRLIVLDVMMPGLSGFRWAEKLRRERPGAVPPIIFLTAKDTENDLLTGFSLGADDYMAKPFSVKELSARIKAVISRSTGSRPAATEVVQIGTLVIDRVRKNVTVDGKTIDLTKTETAILLLLSEELRRVFHRDEIVDRIWGDDGFVMNRTVDVHIARLRKKLGTQGARIVNRSGFGYCLTPETED